MKIVNMTSFPPRCYYCNSRIRLSASTFIIVILPFCKSLHASFL